MQQNTQCPPQTPVNPGSLPAIYRPSADDTPPHYLLAAARRLRQPGRPDWHAYERLKRQVQRAIDVADPRYDAWLKQLIDAAGI